MQTLGTIAPYAVVDTATPSRYRSFFWLHQAIEYALCLQRNGGRPCVAHTYPQKDAKPVIFNTDDFIWYNWSMRAPHSRAKPPKL